MPEHTLKIVPEYFAAVRDGRKTFEVRRDDRGYAPGDTLILREYEPESDEYSGRELTARISYVYPLDLIVDSCQSKVLALQDVKQR
jgi:ASC-1-like (ASCH) protein